MYNRSIFYIIYSKILLEYFTVQAGIRRVNWKCFKPKVTAISDSNWTEWSTIQGVITRVIPKSDEREARGRFEIMSTITPWIVWHEVQSLLLIVSIKNFRIKNVFWESLLGENVSSAFGKFWKLIQTLRRYPITGIPQLQKVQIGHL